MKALVTGATGFVGSHVADTLLERGDRVTVLVRSEDKARRLAERGARLVVGDLHDRDALREAARDQDVVIHVAGLVAARDATGYDRVNRDGTRNLVAAAEGAGRPRFVLVSSLAAAGPARSGRPLSGDEKPAPVTAYGRSKLAGEAVVRASALRWVIVRPPVVYGPRDTELLKVFRIARWGIVPVFGSARQELSAVYAPDLALALLRVAEVEETTERTYFACHPEVVTSGSLARTITRALGREGSVVPLPAFAVTAALSVIGLGARLAGRATILNRDKARELLQPAWTADPARLTRDTGWEAAHDLAAGVHATARWYRGEGWI